MDKRRKSRYRCRIRVRICARGRDYEGYVLDVSETGMRLSTDQVAEAWAGDEVEVVSPEFGLVTGVVRWRTPAASASGSTNRPTQARSTRRCRNISDSMFDASCLSGGRYSSL